MIICESSDFSSEISYNILSNSAERDVSVYQLPLSQEKI